MTVQRTTNSAEQESRIAAKKVEGTGRHERVIFGGKSQKYTNISFSWQTQAQKHCQRNCCSFLPSSPHHLWAELASSRESGRSLMLARGRWKLVPLANTGQVTKQTCFGHLAILSFSIPVVKQIVCRGWDTDKETVITQQQTMYHACALQAQIRKI